MLRRVDSRHKRCVRSLRQLQAQLAVCIDVQHVARCIVFRAIFYLYRLREISTERPESAIRKHRAAAVHAKYGDLRLVHAAANNVSPRHICKQAGHALGAVRLTKYTDGASCVSRSDARRSIREDEIRS